MSLLLLFNQGSTLTFTGDYAASIKAEFRTSGDITGATGYQITSLGDLSSIHGYAYQNLADLKAKWIAVYRIAFDTYSVQGFDYASSADITGTIFVPLNGLPYHGQFDITSRVAQLHQKLYDLSAALTAIQRFTIDYRGVQGRILRNLSDYETVFGSKVLRELVDYEGTTGSAARWTGDITSESEYPIEGNLREGFDAGDNPLGTTYRLQADITTNAIIAYRLLVDLSAIVGTPYAAQADICGQTANYTAAFDYSA